MTDFVLKVGWGLILCPEDGGTPLVGAIVPKSTFVHEGGQNGARPCLPLVPGLLPWLLAPREGSSPVPARRDRSVGTQLLPGMRYQRIPALARAFCCCFKGFEMHVSFFLVLT